MLTDHKTNRLLLQSLVIGLAVLLSGFANARPHQVLRLAATEWCPYTCTEKGGPKGIVADYLTTLLADHHIRIQIEHYPWSRAIALAEKGVRIDGLLTAVSEEAPGLLHTNTPTMTYQDCFYTRSGDNWRYQGKASLQDNDRILGVIADYGYSDEIADYLTDPANKHRVYVMSGQNALWRLVQQLDAGRIDLLIEDPAIMDWTRQRYHSHPAATSLRKTNCRPAEPFFLALNPNLQDVDKLIALLDRILADKKSQDLLESIIASYLGRVR